MRRYDIDWLRINALGLLILYHVVVGFQPWAKKFFFIQNDLPLDDIWIVMSAINVWRIPILFLISGMGVCFAMKRRDWKSLLKDRAQRILIPFIFGVFCICPISTYIAIKYYGTWGEIGVFYVPNPGHLWFLFNIFSYVVLLLPLLCYLKNRPDNKVCHFLSKTFRHPAGLYILSVPFVVEALLIRPEYFEAYAYSSHGFWLGMVCFLVGFVVVHLGEIFWCAVQRLRLVALGLAFSLYLTRLLVFSMDGPHVLTAFESMNWMLAILGYGSLYLNRPSASLTYLSEAVYPVYIVHMPVQFFFSYYLMPTNIPAVAKLILLLGATLGTSLLLYEFIVKRVKWARPLFGMKLPSHFAYTFKIAGAR